ncbi:MAG: hypothetical protein Q8O97_03680 [bacterium]|nr:hypothetical protein [bacterium]
MWSRRVSSEVLALEQEALEAEREAVEAAEEAAMHIRVSSALRRQVRYLERQKTAEAEVEARRRQIRDLEAPRTGIFAGLDDVPPPPPEPPPL